MNINFFELKYSITECFYSKLITNKYSVGQVAGMTKYAIYGGEPPKDIEAIYERYQHENMEFII